MHRPAVTKQATLEASLSDSCLPPRRKDAGNQRLEFAHKPAEGANAKRRRGRVGVGVDRVVVGQGSAYVGGGGGGGGGERGVGAEGAEQGGGGWVLRFGKIRRERGTGLMTK